MRNYGISLLKIIAAFAVVWAHFGLGMGRLTTWAVPSFVLISFWLTSRVITEGDGSAVKKRVLRFVIPFLFWGFIAWVANGVLSGLWSSKSLALQLTLGHAVCPPLYYLFDVCLIVLILWGLAFYFGSRYVLWSGVICFCLLAQYLGLNAWTFGDLAEPYRYPLGRLVELLPYGALGLCLRNPRFSYKWLIGVLFGLGVYKFVDCRVEGFGYNGIGLMIETVCICSFFIALGQKFSERLPKASRFDILSGGVYFTHYIIGSCFVACTDLREGALLVAIIFFSALVVSLLIAHIPILRQRVL